MFPFRPLALFLLLSAVPSVLCQPSSSNPVLPTTCVNSVPPYTNPNLNTLCNPVNGTGYNWNRWCNFHTPTPAPMAVGECQNTNQPNGTECWSAGYDICNGWCDTTKYRCRAYLPLGANCLNTIDRCSFYDFCDTRSVSLNYGTCQRRLGNHQPCESDPQCKSDYKCRNGQCIYLDSLEGLADGLAKTVIFIIVLFAVAGIALVTVSIWLIVRCLNRRRSMGYSATPQVMAYQNLGSGPSMIPLQPHPNHQYAPMQIPNPMQQYPMQPGQQSLAACPVQQYPHSPNVV